MTVQDPWGTSSGLADEYDATVEEMWFGTDSRFGASLLAYFKMRLDDPSVAPNAEDGCVREQYTCGEKWESVDGGETAQSIDEKVTKFATNSQYGAFINRCIKELDMGDILRERGSPQESIVWVGLRFHMEAEERAYSFKDRETGEQIKGTSRRILPSRFLGEDVGSPTAGIKSGPDIDSLGLDEGLLEELTTAAQESNTHSEFVDRALTLTGVAENDKLVLALAKEALWKELTTY